ncbi:hypothetical protein [Ferruginibacter sp. SUN106]|uniref:hypothetical protein n=1 Tax=Ferruginibacter sp. SUN106 TaxID=2978348 RepID=UPI003D35EFF2
MFKISIPKPCFEGWDNMTPNEQGRFCTSCAKTVVDFSVMSDEAIQQYFISNYEQKICGRFKNIQLQRIVIELPQNIFRLQLPFWKKFLVAFLICFGGSFLSIDTTMAGTSFRQGDTISSYKKTTEVKADKKKHKNFRKKKHRRKSNQDILVFEDMVMGNMGWQPPSLPVFPFDSTNYKVLKQNEDTSITVKNTDPTKKNNKEPLPEDPYPATAFILPTALAARNPFSKKKKA